MRDQRIFAAVAMVLMLFTGATFFLTIEIDHRLFLMSKFQRENVAPMHEKIVDKLNILVSATTADMCHKWSANPDIAKPPECP